jgi:hypothetical protein
VELRLAGFYHLAAASRISDEPPLLVAAMNGGSGIGELAGAGRALGF